MIPTLAQALTERGYDTLTPVQLAVTDPDLTGADLLVSAQTGSGKTVGFGLAIAPTLLGAAAAFGPAAAPLALVIAPTRELAMQVRAELTWLYAHAGAVVTSCVGGMDMRAERRALDRGAHIVVATPGRLRDHIMRGGLVMDDLRAVVLDEADEMLDLGFREDLEFILAAAPATRRTLMFSATVPREIVALAQSYQRDARRISTQAERGQHADIDYRALLVAQVDAENAIINVLRFHEARNAIVFCNTRAMVSRLTARFANRGFSVVALSGELSQAERTHALQAMRDGRARVCVATDVAARGIDLPNLELVVHAELPMNAEGLLHRSGRTGRAGRKGISALIVPQKSRRKAERLLAEARITAHWGHAPSADEILRRDEERLLADPVWTDPIEAAEQEFVGRLLALHDPAVIAAAYLRQWRARQSAPEDLADADAPPAPREQRSFGPSVWFALNKGRNDRAEARWILPAICKAGGITKAEIGAIRIQPGETFVEIAAPALAGFLARIGPAMTLDDGQTLRRLDSPPEQERRAPFAAATAPRPRPAPRAPRDADRPAGRADHPADRAERPAGRAERPADHAERPAGRAEQPADHAAARAAHPPDPADRADRTGQRPEDRPLERPADRAGQRPAERPADRAPHPADHAERTAGRPAALPADRAADSLDQYPVPAPLAKPRKPRALAEAASAAPLDARARAAAVVAAAQRNWHPDMVPPEAPNPPKRTGDGRPAKPASPVQFTKRPKPRRP